jgi:Protein of unknown function (DUF3618)
VKLGTASPDDLEARADRLRGEIGSTLDRLRVKLRPRNLASEVAERTGVNDITPGAVLDFAARQHPAATALVALGLGVWAFSIFRRPSKNSGSGAVRETLGALSQSAKKTFSDRAHAKREQFLRSAEAHLAAGASQLSDAVEKGVGELVSRAPGPPEAKPLIESAVQIILITALESLVAKVWR